MNFNLGVVCHEVNGLFPCKTIFLEAWLKASSKTRISKINIPVVAVTTFLQFIIILMRLEINGY